MNDVDRRIRERLVRSLAHLPTEPPSVARIKLLAGSSGRRARRLPGRGRVRLAATVAAATVVVMVALTVPFAVPWGGKDRVPVAASPDLLAAVVAAASRVPAPPGPRKYLYYREVGHADVASATAGPACLTVSELWEAADGTRPGRAVRAGGVATSLTDRTSDPATLRAAPGCPHDVVDVETGPDPQRFARMAADPPDPRALYEETLRVHVAAGHADPQARTFEDLVAILRADHPRLPPGVRTTALRALALVPGVEQDGPVIDELGREGLRVTGPEWSYARERDTVTLSTATGEYLRSTLLGLPTVRTTAVVDSVTARPTR